MGKPAARLGDNHVCPMVTGVVPHVGGPIMPPCAPTVLTGGIPQARVGDMATCAGPPDAIALGSFTVLTMGSPSARIGDMTVHGGAIVQGLPTVQIGDAGGGVPAAIRSLMVSVKPALESRMADVARMIEAMIAAAREGKPFCEQCLRAALARAAEG